MYRITEHFSPSMSSLRDLKAYNGHRILKISFCVLYYTRRVSCSEKLSEDVSKDTSVHEVGHFWLGVKSAQDSERYFGISGDLDLLADSNSITNGKVEGLLTCESERVSVLSILELKGKDSHAEQVRSVDSLIALGNDSLDSLEIWTLCGPITRGSRTVLLTCKNN